MLGNAKVGNLRDEGRKARDEGCWAVADFACHGARPSPLVAGLYQNIGRLQVAVDDAARVGVVHGAGQGLDQGGAGTGVLGFAVQVVRERAAVEKLQRHERLALPFSDFKDLNDVRMLQAGNRLSFAAKAPQIARAVSAETLDRDEPIQLAVPRLVDQAHGAAADEFERVVTGDFRRRNGRDEQRRIHAARCARREIRCRRGRPAQRRQDLVAQAVELPCQLFAARALRQMRADARDVRVGPRL